MSTLAEIFGEPIHTYTVADAIADEAMVLQTPATTTEGGYRIPVVLTAAAHADVIRWTREDGVDQSEDARLWDVLTTMRAAAKRAVADPGTRYGFKVARIANMTPAGNPSRATEPATVSLDVVAQAYDTSGRPCLTVLLPDED